MNMPLGTMGTSTEKGWDNMSSYLMCWSHLCYELLVVKLVRVMGWAFIWNYGKHKKKHEVCARVNKRPSSCLKDTLVARSLISNQVHTGTKTEVCEIFFSSFPFYFLHSLVIKFGRYFINESPLNVCRLIMEACSCK
jgi:hypothetical protein